MKYVFKKICLKKFKLPDFLIRLDDFWKDFTVILYQDGMGRGVAHSRGDMRDTASGHTEMFNGMVLGCVIQLFLTWVTWYMACLHRI